MYCICGMCLMETAEKESKTTNTQGTKGPSNNNERIANRKIARKPTKREERATQRTTQSLVYNKVPDVEGLTLLKWLRLEASGLYLECFLSRHVTAGAFISVLITIRLVAVPVSTVSETGSLWIFERGAATSQKNKTKTIKRINPGMDSWVFSSYLKNICVQGSLRQIKLRKLLNRPYL